MTEKLTAEQILDREFLEIRAKILEIGSSLDRIQRAPGAIVDDRRMELLADGIQILTQPVSGQGSGNRAEQIQLLFSRQYENDWRDKFAIKPRN